MTELGALEAERELALSKIHEINEVYHDFLTILAKWKKSSTGTDEYEEAAGELAAEALVLAAKFRSLDEIFDSTSDDDISHLIERLEELRARIGAKGSPMSVNAFLSMIGKKLHRAAAELPAQATYFRWLKEAREGSLRMSAAHQEMFRKFLYLMEDKVVVVS